MIELMAMESDRVVGVRVDGQIKKADIEAIERAFEDKFARFEKVSIYVEVINLGGIAFDALIEDLKFAFSKFSHFEKKAVVSEHQWLERLAEVGDKLFPSLHVRHFGKDKQEAAIAWIED